MLMVKIIRQTTMSAVFPSNALTFSAHLHRI